MDLRERLYYAQTEFINTTAKYNEQLVYIEMRKCPKYLLDITTNTLTPIIEPPTVYEKWLLDKIEERRVEIFKRFNIEL